MLRQDPPRPRGTDAWKADLMPTADSVTEARRVARIAALAHGLPPTPLELVVTELVTNAIEHAGTPCRLELSIDGVVRIEVTDGDQSVPRPSDDHGVGRPRGRGLQIVSRLSKAWGVVRRGRGKTVWVEIDPDRLPSEWGAPDISPF